MPSLHGGSLTLTFLLRYLAYLSKLKKLMDFTRMVYVILYPTVDLNYILIYSGKINFALKLLQRDQTLLKIYIYVYIG